MPKFPQKRYQRYAKVKSSPFSYRTLISEKQFLKVQERARGIGVNLVSIDYRNFELRFRTESTRIRGLFYDEIVQFSQLSPEDILEGRNLASLLRSAKIKVYSSDPSFLYWGYAYIATKKGYGLYPERRKPTIRNPHLYGYCGKHLYAVLMTLPFLTPKIGKMMKDFWTEEQQEQFRKALDKVSKEVDISTLPDA